MTDRDGGNIKGNYLYPSQLLSGGRGGHLLNAQSTIRTFVIIHHNWFGHVVWMQGRPYWVSIVHRDVSVFVKYHSCSRHSRWSPCKNMYTSLLHRMQKEVGEHDLDDVNPLRFWNVQTQGDTLLSHKSLGDKALSIYPSVLIIKVFRTVYLRIVFCHFIWQ